MTYYGVTNDGMTTNYQTLLAVRLSYTPARNPLPAEKGHRGEQLMVSFNSTQPRLLTYDINFHQFFLSLQQITNIDKLLLTSKRILVPGNFSCANTDTSTFCQELNFAVTPYQALN